MKTTKTELFAISILKSSPTDKLQSQWLHLLNIAADLCLKFNCTQIIKVIDKVNFITEEHIDFFKLIDKEIGIIRAIDIRDSFYDLLNDELVFAEIETRLPLTEQQKHLVTHYIAEKYKHYNIFNEYKYNPDLSNEVIVKIKSESTSFSSINEIREKLN